MRNIRDILFESNPATTSLPVENRIASNETAAHVNIFQSIENLAHMNMFVKQESPSFGGLVGKLGL